MRIEQLQYLIEIADTGTFTTAAEHLHIAQPSISQSISALEAELETKLLLRTRSGAKLTEAGCAVVDHARNILAEIDTIYAISKDHQLPRTVSILAGVIPIGTILPKMMVALEKEFGNIDITIREGSAKLAESMLAKGKIDLAVVPYMDESIPNGFDFIPLFNTPLMAIVSTTSPLATKEQLTLRDIQPFPIALGSEGYTSVSNILSKMQQFGRVNVLLHTQNILLVKQHVMKSSIIGLSYGATMDGKDPNEKEILYIPVKGAADLNFGILTYHQRKRNTLITEVINVLKCVSAEYQRSLNQSAL